MKGRGLLSSGHCHFPGGFCFIILCLALHLSVVNAAGSVQHKPNIIIILADDLGSGDLSLVGSPIRTPHIDRLAKEGARLTDFYASANVYHLREQDY